jgi:hypothetical protein
MDPCPAGALRFVTHLFDSQLGDDVMKRGVHEWLLLAG